jgi:hypothetical protein
MAKKLIKDKKYLDGVNKIIGAFPREFALKLGQIWNMDLVDGYTNQTDVLRIEGELKGHTFWAKGQLDYFLNGEMTFGDITRNIYHEYWHLQNGYEATTSGKFMGRMMDEFLSHYNTIANTTLPQYSFLYGRTYVNAAEGYYNLLQSDEKTTLVEAKYTNLYLNLKARYCEGPLPDPSARPPIKLIKRRDGTIYRTY